MQLGLSVVQKRQLTRSFLTMVVGRDMMLWNAIVVRGGLYLIDQVSTNDEKWEKKMPPYCPTVQVRCGEMAGIHHRPLWCCVDDGACLELAVQFCYEMALTQLCSSVNHPLPGNTVPESHQLTSCMSKVD